MAETTGISWADATFNPWVGCTKVGPGCDNCYAERDMVRRKFVQWGPGAPAAPVLDPAAIADAEKRGYAAGVRAVEPQVERLATLAAAITDAITGFQDDLQRLARTAPAERMSIGIQTPPSTGRERAPYQVERKAPAPRAAAAPGGNLPKGEQLVLTAIAQHSSGVTREQLTVLTGYKRSTRDAYLQRLRERSLIDSDGDVITVTRAGLDALGKDFEPLPTGPELLEYWYGRLPAGERKVLEVVVQGHPRQVDRDVISQKTGYARSSRDAYLQRLSSRQLVIADRGGVRASDTLFDQR